MDLLTVIFIAAYHNLYSAIFIVQCCPASSPLCYEVQDTKSASSWGQNYLRYANLLLCGVSLYLPVLQVFFLIVSMPDVLGGQMDPTGHV